MISLFLFITFLATVAVATAVIRTYKNTAAKPVITEAIKAVETQAKADVEKVASEVATVAKNTAVSVEAKAQQAVTNAHLIPPFK
jgi:ribosomal protein L17